MKAAFFLFTLSAGSAIAIPRTVPPHGWLEVDDVPDDTHLELSFFLRLCPNKVSSLEKEVLDRSNPASSSYGKGWLSNDEVHAMVAPSSEHIQTVKEFIEAHNAKPISRTPNSDVITAVVSVEVAEKMLGADYRNYHHAGSNTSLVRTLSYTLPEPVGAAVSVVGPTTRFTTRTAPIVQSSPVGDGPYDNSPANLRSMYGVGNTDGGVAPANKQAVTAFLGEYYSAKAEANFFKRYLPRAAPDSIKLVGDATVGAAGVEAMLDIEYMPALGALIPSEFWGFSGKSPNSPLTITDEPFLTWLYTVGNTTDDDVPLVFSTSYGEDESIEVPTDYSDRINAEFLKAAGRGISLLFASGDSGAASAAYGGCPDDKFTPTWPAGSPFVTAVGGTINAGLPESAWSGSSGGFSNNFARPEWQEDAVAAFLETDQPDASYYNASGRAYPDIAAQAVDYPVVIGGDLTLSVAGTSCASPTSGGIVGLLNDARLAAGKTSLGFLNPLLYANPDALTDVTSGTQAGCGTTQQEFGFKAVEGWDAVTGHGSLNYERLLDVVMSLP